MNDNYEAGNQNIILNYMNSDKQNEAFYLLTLEINDGEEYQIKIERYSDPSKLAFDFCKVHDLNINEMNSLKETIKKILKQFEIQDTKKNYLDRNNDPIQEVDEENSFFDSKTAINGQITKLNHSLPSEKTKIIKSERKKKKTKSFQNSNIDCTKFNVNLNLTKKAVNFSPIIEKNVNNNSNFNNYSFNLNKKYFTINYLENDKIYKGISNKNSKPKKSKPSYFSNNKKNKIYKSIRNKKLVDSERSPLINSKYNAWKTKTNSLNTNKRYRDKTVNFNGTQVIETTIDLEKVNNNLIYNSETIQNISPNNTDDKLVILFINENKSKKKHHNLKSKTPKKLDSNRCYYNHKLFNYNINNIINKNKAIFSPVLTTKTISIILNNEVSTINNIKLNKTIKSNKHNKILGSDIIKTLSFTKKPNKIKNNVNPFMSMDNINYKNFEIKNQNKTKTMDLLSKKKLLLKKPPNKGIFYQINCYKNVNIN